MMGIAFSLIPAVMWPSVAYIVEEKRLGTAYAVMTLIQQLGVMGVPLVIGFLNDHYQASAENPAGHIAGMWAFSILGFLALFFAIMLRREETGPNAHGLRKPDPTPTASRPSLPAGRRSSCNETREEASATPNESRDAASATQVPLFALFVFGRSRRLRGWFKQREGWHPARRSEWRSIS
jgi:MFS family permease